VTSPLVGVLAAVALVLWYRGRRRRRRVPGGPVIHRDLLEQAEREVRDMPPPVGPASVRLPWERGTPRSPTEL
jgi:hypothetical protein